MTKTPEADQETASPAPAIAPRPDAAKTVKARVLPKGDGLVGKGGDGIAEFHKKGDILDLPKNVAQALEDAGLAEIQA